MDINLAANVQWRRDVLQFVPGLGPRKAQALMLAVQRNGGKVVTRNEMYKELGVLGKTVFRWVTVYTFCKATWCTFCLLHQLQDMQTGYSTS